MKLTVTNVIIGIVLIYVLYTMFFRRETFLDNAPVGIIAGAVVVWTLAIVYVVAGHMGYI